MMEGAGVLQRTVVGNSARDCFCLAEFEACGGADTPLALTIGRAAQGQAPPAMISSKGFMVRGFARGGGGVGGGSGAGRGGRTERFVRLFDSLFV